MKKEELLYLLDDMFPRYQQAEFNDKVEFKGIVWNIDDDSLRHLEIRLSLNKDNDVYPFPLRDSNGTVHSNINMEELRFLLGRIIDKRLDIKDNLKRTYYSIYERINAGLIRNESQLKYALLERSNNNLFAKSLGKDENEINYYLAMRNMMHYNSSSKPTPPKKPTGPRMRYIKE